MPVPDNIPSKPLIPDIEELIAAVAKDVTAPSTPVVPVAPASALIAATPAASPATAQVAIWNRSTVLTDEQVQAAVPAFQIAVSRDFAPLWKTDALLTFVPKTGTPAPGSWIMQVVDDSTQKGVLGFHQVDATNLPQSFVFARTDQQYGLNWEVTLTHELFEMMLDPYALACTFDQSSDTAGRLIPWEAADAVEADALAYIVDGVPISDFILPAWFDTSLAPGSVKFDFCGHLTKALSVAPGGYLSIFQVQTGGPWSQINADGVVGRSADYTDDPRHRR